MQLGQVHRQEQLAKQYCFFNNKKIAAAQVVASPWEAGCLAATNTGSLRTVCHTLSMLPIGLAG